MTNLNNLFRETWNPFIQNTNDLYYDFWELSTVESFAYFLLNYNWLNHENLLSLILLIAKIYYAKLAVFRFVNRENLFRKNFRRPKFLLRRYWCLLIYGPDLLVLMTSWVSDKFDYLIDNEKFSFPYIYGWIWVGMSFF